MLSTFIQTEKIPNLYIASIKDIAAMKLIAISQRGAKKDFFDLYNICVKNSYRLADVFNSLNFKYDGNKINYAHVIQSLTYFEDAENEILPKVFIDFDWNKLKQFYIKEQRKLFDEL